MGLLQKHVLSSSTITSRTHIIISSFQCHNALWLFNMPIYLLETGRASKLDRNYKRLSLQKRAILLKTHPANYNRTLVTISKYLPGLRWAEVLGIIYWRDLSGVTTYGVGLVEST